jgi:DNA excision repair protein ERCC-4
MTSLVGGMGTAGLHSCLPSAVSASAPACSVVERMMDFRIVTDTREQAPYGFACQVIRKKLDAGDYSVEGREHVVAVERKSLADFVHTVIHDFPRFAVELEKLARLSAACVVVEADLDHVLRGLAADTLRGVAPDAVMGAALAITLRYCVPVFWCGSRQAALAFTEAFLRCFVRNQSGGKPERRHV